MAKLKSLQSGNFTNPTTWGTVISLAENITVNTGANYIFITTTQTSSQSFTITSANNLLGVLVKLVYRVASPTGTTTVELFDSTVSAVRATVTVNNADFPAVGTNSVNNFHWVYIRFNTPLNTSQYVSGNNHQIRMTSSVTSQIGISFQTTTTAWARGIVTDLNATPAAGDTFVITGDITSSGTSNIDITMDNTASTKFGVPSGGTISVTGEIYGFWIGHNATLTYGTTPGTNYLLSINDNVGIGSGGTLNIGTIANPMPRTSTGVLEIDCGTTQATQKLVVNGGILNLQGLSRTTGNDTDRCLLNANAALGATSLTVDRDTGWLSGDEVGISRTERGVAAPTPHKTTLASNATPTTLTLTSGLTTAAREGDINTVQATILLLTRNVVIRAANILYPALTFFRTNTNGSSCVVDSDWAALKYMAFPSSGFGYTSGIDASGLTPSTGNFNYTLLEGSGLANTTSTVFYNLVGPSAGITLTNSTSYTAGLYQETLNALSSHPDTLISNCWTVYGQPINVGYPSFTVTGIRAASLPTSSPSNFIGFGTARGQSMPTNDITWSDIVLHGGGAGIVFGTSSFILSTVGSKFTINNLDCRRCNTQALLFNNADNITINGIKLIGCVRGIICLNYNSLKFKNGIIAGDPSNITTSGILMRSSAILGTGDGDIIMDNVVFDPAYRTAEIEANPTLSVSGNLKLTNCTLAQSPFSGNLHSSDELVITSENHYGAVGNKRIIYKYGEVSIENTILYPGDFNHLNSLGNGLIGAWSPSVTGPTGQDLLDLSGFNSTGSLLGFDLSNDWVLANQYALNYDGVDNRVSVNNFKGSLLNSTSTSASCWINPTSTNNNLMFLSCGTNGQNFSFRFNFQNLEFSYGAASPLSIAFLNSTYANVWTHIAGVTESGTARIFINGVQVASSNAAYTTLTSDGLGIGYRFGLTSYFSGLIDDTRVYNRSLTASEVFRLYTSGRGCFLSNQNKVLLCRKTKVITSILTTLRLTPNNADVRLSYTYMKCAVRAGVNHYVSLQVKKSTLNNGAAYNGQQPRLILKRNPIVGVNSDTVIAVATSASDGEWELVGGALPTITANGVIELVIDCNGTTGWINIREARGPAANTLEYGFTDDTLEFSAVGTNFNAGKLISTGGSLIT